MTRLVLALCAAGLAALPVSAQRAPAPGSVNLPGDVLALACAPSMAFATPPMPLRITGGQDSFVRRIFVPGDLVTLNAGTDNGIEVGQQFYARRVQVQGGQAATRSRPGVIRTAGWIRVYAVDDRMSLATIEHACDTIEQGDFLEPFELPSMPAVSAERPKAQRENY